MVGSNWLNKLGVLIFVIGIALLVSYSFTRVGAGGRIAIGYTVSLTMLGVGVLLERRAAYVAYGYGLVAGGWAATYFTTFAMHGLEAARVIDNELAGGVLLTLVAGAMVAHSIRYRSQTVTVLAFVVAYATLAIAPVSWFALFAALPLATTVLVVANRHGWVSVSTLGVAATYVLFVLRGVGVGGDALDGGALAPYVMLGVYWLVFEGADVMRLRQVDPETPQSTSLFALNATGLVGCTVLVVPAGGAGFLPAYLAVMGAAYAASAILRRRLLPGDTSATGEPAKGLTTFHLAVAMATALVMWSSATRFDEDRLAIAWLVEAQLIVAIGFVLADPIVRKTGGGAFLLAVAYGLLGTPYATLTITSMAVAAYLNREWLRARGAMSAALERGYAWAGAGLVAIVLVEEFGLTFRGLAFMLAAAVLLEAGLRRAAEYRYQAYALGVAGAGLVLAVFGSWVPLDPRDVWAVLPAATLIAWAGALRLSWGIADSSEDERPTSAAAVAWLGMVLLALLEWHVVPRVWLGPVWAATAMALFGAGLVRNLGPLRWQGYALMLVGSIPAFMPILIPIVFGPPASSREITALVMTIILLYTASLLGSRTVSWSPTRPEAWALRGLSSVAAAMLTTLQWRVVAGPWSGPVIAATGAMHFAFGVVGRARFPRWQGYTLLMVGALRAFMPILGSIPAAHAQIAAALVGVGLLYAVSFTSHRREGDSNSSDERLALQVLPTTATAMLAILEWRVLDVAWSGPVMAVTGSVLLEAGVATRLGLLRWHGYSVLLLASVRAFGPVLGSEPPLPAETLGFLVAIGLAYAGCFRVGRALRVAPQQREPEAAALGALFLVATLLLATFEWRVLPLVWSGPVMVLTGLVFYGAGAIKRVLFLRLPAYGLLGLAVLRAIGPLTASRGAPLAEIVSLGGVIGGLYLGSYLARRALRTEAWETEPMAPRALLGVATVLLTWLIAAQVHPSFVTLSWGLLGLSLLIVGFPLRERIVRLLGLALLALCILKLFIYDLRTLEALARIVSFVALGLALLGVSWVYTRFGERIRKYL